MGIFKQWKFWLPLVSLVIVLIHFLGYDDMGIMFFFSSPPVWLVEWHVFAENVIHPSDIPMAVLYAATLVVWFLIGMLLDKLFAARHRD